jgi:hypothetical protein
MKLAFDTRLKVISEFQLPTAYTSSGPFSAIQCASWLHHRLTRPRLLYFPTGFSYDREGFTPKRETRSPLFQASGAGPEPP